MRNRVIVLVAPIFALTGFSALVLQVVWQRVISLHSGVDLSSTTTVVAAFLAGLGIGNLVGGRLADRLGPTRSLAAFSVANVGIGLFAWLSIGIFYDGYRELAPSLQSTFASFWFNVAILIVPTTLMGMSLPFVARAVTAQIGDAGRLVGKLYGVNTLGAALGAATAGWYLLGTFGFVATTRFAGSLNLIAAALIAGVWWILRSALAAPAREAVAQELPLAGTVEDDVEDEDEVEVEVEVEDEIEVEVEVDVEVAVGGGGRVWPWFAIYGVTGAVALGFEQVFFRLIDAEMRSNSYSFAHVLTLYLLLFGLGSWGASRLVRPGRDPRRWFLGLQFLVGVSALVALIAFTRGLPALWFDGALENYFGGDGYNAGFGVENGWREWAKIALVYLVIPVGLMGMPVLFMGASFPFVQALVADRVDTLGRRTGQLLFTNICGNVAGTLLVGFVFLDRFGTAGTYRLLALVLGIAGIGGALLLPAGRRRTIELVAVVVTLTLVIGLMPSNQQLWAFLHGVDADDLDVAEGHACAAALRHRGDEAMMTINGSSQNPHPFDDFHVLIGLMPALAHPNPTTALSIGMGMGSTTFGMLQDSRLESVITVELCGEQYELLEGLADAGRVDFQRMFADPRYDARVGDGRKFLLADDTRYDVITVDTLRATSAFSGSLYSREFYELLDDHLADDGIVAQWVATGRVVNTAAQVFPHMIAITVPSYGNSTFFLGSRQPLDLDAELLAERFGSVPVESFSEAQRGALHGIIRDGVRRCINDGSRATGLSDAVINRDLRPRDEYFINNDRHTPELIACSQ